MEPSRPGAAAYNYAPGGPAASYRSVPAPPAPTWHASGYPVPTWAPPPPPSSSTTTISPNYGPVPPAASAASYYQHHHHFSAPPPPSYTASSPSYASYSNPPSSGFSVAGVAAASPARHFSMAGTTASSPYYSYGAVVPQSPSRSFESGGSYFPLPASSPRIDGIPSITQRLERFVRAGTALSMLRSAEVWQAVTGEKEFEENKRKRQNASASGTASNSSASSASAATSSSAAASTSSASAASKLLPSYKDSSSLPSAVSPSNTPSSSTATTTAVGTLDRFLRRRTAFAQLEPDQIVKGIVYDKTDHSLVLTITEVYRTTTSASSTPSTKETLLHDLQDLNIQVCVWAGVHSLGSSLSLI
jgi:hypothetical protein